MRGCLEDFEVLELVEGQLELDALQGVESHLDTCSACHDAVAAAVHLVGDEPTPDDVPAVGGRYQLVAPIGYGGSGIVYRARDLATGGWVAVKTVQLRAPEMLSAIRREVHVLSRLHHPGIVRIFDHGVDGARPWYAMELLDGVSLVALHQRMWTSPPITRTAAGGQLGRVLAIARRLCEPLAFLHGEGIVHRDLKLQNVFVRPDDQVVLVDFGLIGHTVGRHGREVLEVLGANGTPAYMAPEQIAGEPIDARTDLYALGCMLYELVAGHPPFVGATADEILRQHLRTAPPSLAHEVDVPPALAELVASLLAKQPRDRIGHAEEVALALERLGAPSAATGARSVAPIYRPLLHGRESLVCQLAERADTAYNGRGGIVVLAGESGIGKTFVAGELVRRCRRMVAVSGICLPNETVARGGAAIMGPFAEVLDLLADRCIADGEATERLLGARGKVLAAVSPRLLALPGQHDHPAPPALVGTAARDRLFIALAETLAALARELPLLVIVDDLQWADELTLGFLAWLDARFFAHTRILIVATCRSDEGTAALAFEGRPCCEVIHLQRLDAPAVQSLVADMLAQAPPTALTSQLVRRAGGNPFFVTELIRAAVAAGALRRVDGAWVGDDEIDALAMPPTIGDVVQRRLASLSPTARGLAEVAAVLGRELDPTLVLRMLGGALSQEAVMEATAELLRRQVLEPSTPERVRFVHHILQEVLHRDLTPARRRDLHRAAAVAIETEHGTSTAAHFAILGYHLAEAGDDRRAVSYLHRAGEVALALGAYNDASSAFARALELVDADTGELEHAQLRFGLARASLGIGEVAQVEEHALGVLRLLGIEPPQTRAEWRQLIVQEARTQLRHLVLGPPRNTHDDASKQRLRAQAGGLLSELYYYRDRARAMTAMSLVAINAAERSGIDNVARPYIAMGGLAAILRARRLSARYFARAHRAADIARDLSESAQALNIEALAQGSLGRWQRARALTDRLAQDWLPRLSDPVDRARAMMIHCHVSHYLGRDEEALRWGAAVLAEAEASGSPQHRMWGQLMVARSLCHEHRWSEALPLLDEALHMVELRPELIVEIPSAGLAALACIKTGALARARLLADRTLALLARARGGGFPSLSAYWPVAEVYRTLLDGADGSEAEELAARWHSLRKLLWRVALVMPTARPLALLEEGHYHRHGGRRWLAHVCFSLAGREARRCSMAREAKLASTLLGSTT